MKRYRMYQAPIMAFFSKSFYRDVCLHWKGTGFLYLFLLLAVCQVPSFLKFHHSVDDYVQNKAPALTAQIPQIRIINGEASVDVAQPYKIINPNSGAVILLIDTSGKTVSPEGTGARALLTRTEVIVKKSDFETRIFSLKNIDDFTLDQKKVTGWLTAIRRYAAFVFFPFAIIMSYVFRIVQLLLYAAIGLLFAKWCKTSKPYLALLRLAVMAITPVIIVGTAIGIVGVKIPFKNLLFFALAMVYLFFGIKAASREQETQDGKGNALRV